jgi:hypothetical protein
MGMNIIDENIATTSNNTKKESVPFVQCAFWIESKKKKCKNKHEELSRFCRYHKNKYVIPPHNTLSKILETPEKECCICLEELTERDNPLLPCGHTIHLTCIYSSGKMICPICRIKLDLTPDQISKMKILPHYTTDPFYQDNMEEEEVTGLSLLNTFIHMSYLIGENVPPPLLTGRNNRNNIQQNINSSDQQQSSHDGSNVSFLEEKKGSNNTFSFHEPEIYTLEIRRRRINARIREEIERRRSDRENQERKDGIVINRSNITITTNNNNGPASPSRSQVIHEPSIPRNSRNPIRFLQQQSEEMFSFEEKAIDDYFTGSDPLYLSYEYSTSTPIHPSFSSNQVPQSCTQRNREEDNNNNYYPSNTSI